MKHDLPNFALLIDADNDTPDIITPVIEEITRDARLSVRRVYGDFTSPNLAKWREALANHGIQPVQQYRNSVGKNASDSALIIDAMDLLHGRRLDGFCLVSSDGDFTRLATRIREDGLSVFGFGRKHAPKAFVSACERYTYVENLGVAPVVEKDRTSTSPMPPPSIPQAMPHAPLEAPKPRPIEQAITEKNKLRNLLLRAYTNVADDDGWALVSRIALYLRANHSDFDPRSFGASNFIKLLESSGSFELKQRKQGNGNAPFCRINSSSTNLASPLTQVLIVAVSATANRLGWSKTKDIRAHLELRGYRPHDFSSDSIDAALRKTKLFDMCDASSPDERTFKLASGRKLA